MPSAKRLMAVVSATLPLACYTGAPDGREDVAISLGDGGADSGDDADEAPEDASSSSDSGARDDGEVGGDGGESTSDEGGATDGEPNENALAKDVTVSELQFNQAVAIDVVADGEVLPQGARNGELIPSRPATVRGVWTVAPGFEPRELEARLLLRNQGVVSTYAQVRQVDGAADATTIQGGFLWDVPADDIQPDTEFAVEMRETTPGAEPVGDEASGARVPSLGFTLLEVTETVPELEVVLIPFVKPDAGLTIDLTPQAVQTIGRALYEQYPVNNVSIVTHAPIQYTNPITTYEQWTEVLGFLSSLRAEDQADPEQYYAGLVNIGCPVVGCGDFGTNGSGYTPTASQLADPALRASIVVWTDAATSADVLVHEIGHNHTLRHVACPGTSPDGAALDYPYADGTIGRWGWAAFTGALHGAGTKDFMSYCDPSWVSDWTWNKTLDHARFVASLPSAAPTADALLAIVHGNGEQAWFRVAAPESSAAVQEDSRVMFSAAGRTLATVPATDVQIGDGSGRAVYVRIPAAAAGFDALVWQHDGARDVVPTASLRSLRSLRSP